jgi:hypothetical protein
MSPRLREFGLRPPALVGYALAKALLLAEDRGLEFDLELIEAAVTCAPWELP